MQAELDPEPAPGEREAILRALERLYAGGDGARQSAWWRHGLGEAVGLEADEPGDGFAANASRS